MPANRPAFCALPQLGVYRVSGRDAAAFLHAQLAIDVDRAAPDAAPLAAWAAPNGRVRLLARLIGIDSDYALIAPRALEETITRKLAMFVLRADVRIALDPGLVVGALLDAPADWLEVRIGAAPEDLARVSVAGGTRLISIGPRLLHVVAPPDTLAGIAAEADAARPARVEAAEIELGLPEIVPATAERFLPQMLNLDGLGFLSLDKGCYPGQEVIARTHNLGTVKRRLRCFTAAAGVTAAAGDVLLAGGDEAGCVLRAAALDEHTLVLAVARLDAAPPWQLGTAAGPALAAAEHAI